MYDVVLTDIVMGNIDGIEVANAARHQPDPPEVVLLTGHATLDTAIAAVRAGAFDYLQKPCQTAQLRERLAAAVERRRLRLQQTRAAETLQRVAETISQIQRPAGPPPGPAPGPAIDPAPDLSAQPILYSERYLNVGALRIDTHRHEVWFDDEQLHVTPTEYTLLFHLATSPGQVLSFLELARPIYGEGTDHAEARDLIRWHLRNLQRKFSRRYIVSVRGVGYMLINPDEHHLSKELDI